MLQIAWKSHRRRSLVGCSPRGREESDSTEQLYFHFSLWCIGEGNGNPLQCSCLENPRDGGAWWAAVYGVTQSRTRLKRLSICSKLHYIKSILIFSERENKILYSAIKITHMKMSISWICYAKSLQLCPTLCDPIDGSPPGSSVPGIFQARVLEWIAISFSNAWKWKVKGK